MVSGKMIDRMRGTVIERRVRRQFYIDSCRGTNVVVACRKKSSMMACWLGGTSKEESLDFGIFENIAKIQMMVMMV